jgi:hypothetical protein
MHAQHSFVAPRCMHGSHYTRPGLVLAPIHRHNVQGGMHCHLLQNWLHNCVPWQDDHLRPQCTCTGLWMIPLAENTTPPTTMPTTSPNSIKLAANADATSSAAEYARYVHQLLCSPPAATLLLALNKSTKLQTVPGLMPALICAHLP